MTNQPAPIFTPDRTMSSEFMQWAKTNLRACFNLASSGLMNYPLAELPVRLEDLELSGPSYYGYEPLQKALAAKTGAPIECVVAATGTSMANHLALAAMIEAGDEVLIERPTYELIVSAAEYLGARVKFFERRHENDFQIDAGEIERLVTPKTRLVVITNLHNPSSVYADETVLRRIGAIAERVGARVLVDEVYLDTMFADAPPPSFHLGENFVVTNSLTKTYGLSGLRCGWILAASELAEKMNRLNDLFAATNVHVAERLSLVALKNLETFRTRARNLLAANRPLLNSFLDSRDDLEAVRTAHGSTSFPRLLKAEPEKFFALLREKYETSVVPGRFFYAENYFRIGITCDTEMLREGLERLSAALDEMKDL